MSVFKIKTSHWYIGRLVYLMAGIVTIISLSLVLFTGAIFLGLIAVLPSIVAGITGVTGFAFLVGGTSLLIVVSVVLDTVRQINAQLQMREYETF